MLGRHQVHRAALAAQQAIIAAHQLAQNTFNGDAACQRVRVSSIRAETEVARLHGGSTTGSHSLLSEGQMAGALHQILQKQIVGTLFCFADHNLGAVHFEAQLLSDIAGTDDDGGADRSGLCFGHD